MSYENHVMFLQIVQKWGLEDKISVDVVSVHLVSNHILGRAVRGHVKDAIP